jgi:hypothetical protein
VKCEKGERREEMNEFELVGSTALFSDGDEEGKICRDVRGAKLCATKRSRGGNGEKRRKRTNAEPPAPCWSPSDYELNQKRRLWLLRSSISPVGELR